MLPATVLRDTTKEKQAVRKKKAHTVKAVVRVPPLCPSIPARNPAMRGAGLPLLLFLSDTGRTNLL